MEIINVSLHVERSRSFIVVLTVNRDRADYFKVGGGLIRSGYGGGGGQPHANFFLFSD